MSLATAVASLAISKLNVLAVTASGMLVSDGGVNPNPILPHGRPKGSDGVIHGAKYILGWVVLIGVAVGLIFTVIYLIRGLYSREHSPKDAIQPLLVTLVLSSFATVFGVAFGIFNGVVGAFS